MALKRNGGRSEDSLGWHLGIRIAVAGWGRNVIALGAVSVVGMDRRAETVEVSFGGFAFGHQQHCKSCGSVAYVAYLPKTFVFACALSCCCWRSIPLHLIC